MAFNDLSFLFIFFPVVLLLHKLIPGMKGKNILLLVFSLVFFAWGTPEYMLLMVLIILFNYFSGLQMAEQKKDGKENGAKVTLITSVVANLLLLGFFKYWGFVLENINALLRTSIPVRQLSMPIGVSFFTFSILSYLYDVYRDKAPAAKDLLEFSLFVTFFPKLVSGPIVQYSVMEKQIHQRKTTKARFGWGCRLFLVGLAKKVLLSNTIGTTFYAVTALEEVSVATAWLGAVSYALMLYFDFGGYSDMAIGLAGMFGFDFDKNFDYPYMSSSVTEFWRRWHISLGSWFRDYIYIPLGGSRVSTGKIIRNLMVVWCLTGVWHGASWNYIFWGLYYGGLLILEKFVLKNVLEYVPKAIKWFFTLILVLIGWVFFFSASLGDAFTWVGRMFGIGANGFVDPAAKYYISGSWKVLLIGAVASFPFCAKQANHLLKGESKLPVYLSVVWFAVLLLLCIAGMMSSTYSSFLYFQF